MSIAIFSGDFSFLFRWIHFLAGITWIGVLYYFNFIQGEWFKETSGDAKSAALQKLVPRALWWFRWGAMFTFISGFIILSLRFHFGTLFINSPAGVFIMTGSLMGTFMFLNVWLIIWPAQQVVIASAEKIAGGGEAIPEAAGLAAKGALASRTNTLFSFPMLFFMAAGSHLNPGFDNTNFAVLWAVLIIVVVIVELNAIFGKMFMMASVKGVIHAGILLTIILYGLVEILA